jgi:hypothetical protein
MIMKTTLWFTFIDATTSSFSLKALKNTFVLWNHNCHGNWSCLLLEIASFASVFLIDLLLWIALLLLLVWTLDRCVQRRRDRDDDSKFFCFVSNGAKMIRQCELWQRELAISLTSIVAWLRCFSSSSTWNKSLKAIGSLLVLHKPPFPPHA